MPLKPGQKKDLKVTVKKLEGLQKLENKVEELSNALRRLKVSPSIGKSLQKEFEILSSKVNNEIAVTQKEIKVLQAKQSKTNPALDKLIKTIAKECSSILPYYRKTNEILLRGVKSKNPNAFIGRSWKNREPVDSDIDVQKIYDAQLQKIGYKALRSNSIFTTTDAGFAEQYGRAYYIFPKNGFNWHWTSDNPDLVLDNLHDILDEDKIYKIIDNVNGWYYKTYKKELNWYYDDAYDVLRDFDGFIKKLKQIKYPKVKDINIMNLVDPYFFKNLGLDNKNLTAALDSGNEVMISGEYYAIRAYTDVAKAVLKGLKLKSDLEDDDDY